MSIKPGTLCYLIRCAGTPEWEGRIVTATVYMPNTDLRARDGRLLRNGSAWQVTAPWLPTPPFGPWAWPPSALRPINDPDIYLPEMKDEEATA